MLSIPQGLLISQLFPFLPDATLSTLAIVAKEFHALAWDERVWSRRLHALWKVRSCATEASLEVEREPFNASVCSTICATLYVLPLGRQPRAKDKLFVSHDILRRFNAGEMSSRVALFLSAKDSTRKSFSQEDELTSLEFTFRFKPSAGVYWGGTLLGPCSAHCSLIASHRIALHHIASHASHRIMSTFLNPWSQAGRARSGATRD